MEQQTILAMYSGGLDSLGMVYQLLTDPAYAEYGLHIHHVNNRSIENRHAAEAIMVNMSEQWIDSICEGEEDYKDLPRRKMINKSAQLRKSMHRC